MVKEFDIKIRTKNFSKDLLMTLKTIPDNFENIILKKQVIRSGTSIGANVHESKGGTSKKDFSHYFSIALNSANETDYWLELLSDTNPKISKELNALRIELDEICRILAKIVIKSRKDS